MWKLVFIISFLFEFPFLETQTETVIIVDDCQKWRKGLPGKYPEAFSFSKDLENYENISLIHGWLVPEKRLTTKTLTFSEISVLNPIFTSEMSYTDWNNLLKNPKLKFYILRPDCFCSKSRFEFGYEFKVYEVIVSLSAKE